MNITDLIKLVYKVGIEAAEKDEMLIEAGVDWNDKDLLLIGLDSLNKQIENLTETIKNTEELAIESILKI